MKNQKSEAALLKKVWDIANAENVIELAQEIENTADEKASEEFIATNTDRNLVNSD